MRTVLRIIKNLFILLRIKLGKKRPVHKGSIRVQSGQTLYEVNLETGEYKPAETELGILTSFNLVDGKKTRKSRRLIERENCIYIQALNEKNLLRKLKNKAQAAGVPSFPQG
jgi:hypothetical protein